MFTSDSNLVCACFELFWPCFVILQLSVEFGFDPLLSVAPNEQEKTLVWLLPSNLGLQKVTELKNRLQHALNGQYSVVELSVTEFLITVKI